MGKALPPITLLFDEHRRWHPDHCYLYYTDSGELIARFTIDELRDLKRRDSIRDIKHKGVSGDVRVAL
jgi:hypothetical protein